MTYVAPDRCPRPGGMQHRVQLPRSRLKRATSAFQEVQKVHLVIRRAKLRESNRDVAGVDQDEGVMPDTGQSATESTMWTAQLAALQGYRPRTLLCVEVADDFKLSTHEQRDDLLRQLCHPLLEIQTRAATTADEKELLVHSGTSSIAAQYSSSRGNRGVDLASGVTAANSSPKMILAAARARGPRSTCTLHPSINRSGISPSAQVAARSHCELLLKLSWLPSPLKCSAAWSMLSQLTSLQTLLLSQDLTGETVAALSGAAPQLRQLSLTVTGRDHAVWQLSQLQKLNSLHIRAINTDHWFVSMGICGLSQLRHLNITGDLILQPPSIRSAFNWLSVQLPQLQTLVLQQPLNKAQLAALMRKHNGHLTAAEQPSAGAGNSVGDCNCVAGHARGLQQLSVWVQDSSDIPAYSWCDSSINTLRKFQQAVNLMWHEGIMFMVHPLGGNNISVAVGSVAVAMSQQLQHPSDPDAGSLIRSALLKGSSRPSSILSTPLCSSLRLRTLESSSNRSLWSSQLGTTAPGHAGLQQLLVRCGASCNLSAVLQQCQPQELSVVTVPAGVDIWQQVGVAVYSRMISDSKVPRPRLMVLSLRAGTDQMLWCLKSLTIDTSPTQAGLILPGVLLIMVACSCPSLVYLQLRGILDIDQLSVAALGQGCKDLKVLTLIDTRVQALKYLATTIAAIADTPEPEPQRQLRLRRLAVLWRRFVKAGILSGMAVGVRQPKRRRGILLWAVATVLTMNYQVGDIDAEQHWYDQVVVLRQLTAAADMYTNIGRVPRIMACWLPTGLRSLHLENCELCSHANCLGCRAFADSAQRDGIDAEVRVCKESIAAEGKSCSELLNSPWLRGVQNQPASLAGVLQRSLRACKRPLSQLRLKGFCTYLCMLAAGEGLVIVGYGVGASALRLASRGQGNAIPRAPSKHACRQLQGYTTLP